MSFIYDGRNRCVARTTVTATSGSTVWFVWGHEQSSHWGLLEERDADGDLVARYVHGERIDEILRREAGASTVFYHHDALGSTIALTDASGALVEQYRYDVNGLPTIMDASGSDLGSRTSAFGNRFMFTGREWLSDLGLYDYRHRAYSPTLGRWFQPDPIGFAAGDVNLYRYCSNQEEIDPTGLCPPETPPEVPPRGAKRGKRHIQVAQVKRKLPDPTKPGVEDYVGPITEPETGPAEWRKGNEEAIRRASNTPPFGVRVGELYKNSADRLGRKPPKANTTKKVTITGVQTNRDGTVIITERGLDRTYRDEQGRYHMVDND